MALRPLFLGSESTLAFPRHSKLFWKFSIARLDDRTDFDSVPPLEEGWLSPV